MFVRDEGYPCFDGFLFSFFSTASTAGYTTFISGNGLPFCGAVTGLADEAGSGSSSSSSKAISVYTIVECVLHGGPWQEQFL